VVTGASLVLETEKAAESESRRLFVCEVVWLSPARATRALAHQSLR
jgi:hypothetical protein